MIKNFELKNQKWASLNQPVEKEIEEAVNRFNIDPFITKEIATPTPRSRVEFHKDSIYLILHFPAFKHSHKNLRQEIDFIIKKDSLITIQYENIDYIDKFIKEAEVSEILKNSNGKNIFSSLMKEIYSSLNDEIIYTESWINNITKKVFKGNEKDMVFEISEAIRTLLEFEKITEPHKEIFEFLTTGGEKMFGTDFKYDMEILLNEHNRFRKNIINNLAILKEIRETNAMLLNTKQNDIMKTLTVITFIYLPINLIVAIFTIHANNTPFWNHPNSFYIIMGLCFITLLIMIYIARHKKWM